MDSANLKNSPNFSPFEPTAAPGLTAFVLLKVGVNPFKTIYKEGIAKLNQIFYQQPLNNLG
jgi:hypothetical protein